MGFTDTETRQIRAALEGTIAFTHALEGLGDAFKGMTTANRAALVEATRQLARAARDVASGSLALVGALPEEMALAEAPRAAQLEFAWNGPPFGLKRAIEDSLPAASEAMSGVTPLAFDLPRSAAAAFAALDRAALLHSDPPPGGTFGGRRTIIGPHGDFYISQHYGHSAIHYLNDWAQEGFLPVLEAVPLRYRLALADAWKVYAMLFRLYVQAVALDAGVSTHTRWDNLPPLQGSTQFAKSLAALGLLQRAVKMSDGDGAPELYMALGEAWLALLDGVPAGLRPAWKRGQNRLNDSWRRGNQKAWMANFFPDRRAG